MNYKIQNHPPMTIAGYRSTIDMERAPELIPGLWDKVSEEQYKALNEINNRPPKAFIGAEVRVSETKMEYYIGVATEDDIPVEMDTFEVPPGTWAIIEAVGPLPGSIQAIWQEISQTEGGFTHEEYVWAPGKPDLEVYPHGDKNAADYKCHVWLPLRPHWAENTD